MIFNHTLSSDRLSNDLDISIYPAFVAAPELVKIGMSYSFSLLRYLVLDFQ